MEVFCGKLCAKGNLIAFIAGAPGKYPHTFASKSTTASAIISTLLIIADHYSGSPAWNICIAPAR